MFGLADRRAPPGMLKKAPVGHRQALALRRRRGWWASLSEQKPMVLSCRLQRNAVCQDFAPPLDGLAATGQWRYAGHWTRLAQCAARWKIARWFSMLSMGQTAKTQR